MNVGWINIGRKKRRWNEIVRNEILTLRVVQIVRNSSSTMKLAI